MLRRHFDGIKAHAKYYLKIEKDLSGTTSSDALFWLNGLVLHDEECFRHYVGCNQKIFLYTYRNFCGVFFERALSTEYGLSFQLFAMPFSVYERRQYTCMPIQGYQIKDGS